MTIDVIFNILNKNTESLSAIGKQLDGIGRTINQVQDGMWKFNQTAELFDKMGAAVSQITQPYIAFEQSMANLSSITGIAGDDLARLGAIARETGVSSGLGATGAADAFALLASQIDVSKIGMDGLIELQGKTITLAQASGMTMTEAANSMAGTINQFGLQADAAGRIINVLAAGSKYGAAEIPELAQSFKVVGAAANAAGLTVEQTAGAIETLSKNNLKGAEAGTALRNIMLKMQTQLGVDFSKTSLSTALDALKPRLRDATYLSQLFGMENVAAAQFLIANSDTVKEMTDRVTGTAVATEQAAITTDTWNHRLKVQSARINEVFMSISESNQGFFSAIQVTSQLSSIFLSFTPLFSAMGTGLSMIGGGVAGVVRVARAFGLMNAAMQAGRLTTYAALVTRFGAAGKIAAAGIWAKTAALKLFNLVSKASWSGFAGLIAQTWAWTAALWANPVTWIVAAIIALVAIVIVCWNEFAGFRAVLLTVWDVLKGFGLAIWQQITMPFKVAAEMVQGVIGALKALASGDFSGAWDAIKGALSNSVDAFAAPGNTVVETAKTIPDSYDKHLAVEQEKDKPKRKPLPEKSIFDTPADPVRSMPGVSPLGASSEHNGSIFDYPSPGFAVSGFDSSGSTTGEPFVLPDEGKKKRTQPLAVDTSDVAGTSGGTSTATVNIDYKPTINISSEMGTKERDSLMELLRRHASEVTQIVKEELRKEERRVYGLS